MYEVYKIGEDTYQIHSTFRGEKAMEGTLVAIFVYAVDILGFRADDLEEALLDMHRNDNDAAHFGINRTFIFSFKRSERKVS